MATDIALALPKLSVSAETYFTVARLREFVTTSLSDAVLQTLLDDALYAINAEIGPRGEVSEFLTARGDLILLSRRAESITSVTEWWSSWLLVGLDATDYQLRQSGQQLQRLRTGTHPATWLGGYGWGWGWRGRVEVVYQPFDDLANRLRAAVELIKLELAYAPGLQSETIGTWSVAYQRNDAYDKQRLAILASLSGNNGGAV